MSMSSTMSIPPSRSPTSAPEPAASLSVRLWHGPAGPIVIGADDRLLHYLKLLAPDATLDPAITDSKSSSPLLNEAVDQLEAWFDHRLRTFDLPLAPAATPRGEDLRAAIASIPYGSVASYGELARQAGTGPRAIGQACRRNPFVIVIPCHRVIAAGQSIGHYSAGQGLASKQQLIDHERSHSPH